MARLDVHMERSLSGSTSKDDGAVCEDEKRAAAPVDEDDEDDSHPAGSDCCADDDKSVIVLSKEELLPYEEDEVSAELLVHAIQNMREQEDWLIQHEAIVTLRRLIVHHSSVVEEDHVDAFLDFLILGCDNLRSALSKNALLAFAECFEFLSSNPRQSEKFLSHGVLLDVLLRRSACEKKFLRDAAAIAVEQLVHYLASWQLMKSAGAYAKNKNGRLCGNAARVVSSSLTRLHKQHNESIARMFAIDDGKQVRAICQALATFRGAKDKAARNESARSFRLLGEAVGKDAFEFLVKSALKDQLAASRIVNEVFPVSSGAADQSKARRGSLRERMLLQEAS